MPRVMVIVQTVSDLDNHLAELKANGFRIGFIPTMGALHPGHLSLIKRAMMENDRVVCSIFINPTQFNDIKDLQQYPRMPEADLQLLDQAGCHVVFLPEVKEIYKAGESLLNIDLGLLETTMEGFYRPGHFNGVATVVHKLFTMVKPDAAYFGEKDFQQLAVIRRMTQIMGHKTVIVGCTTLRESDGLAMSSRNLLLTREQRSAAPLIYKIISGAGELLKQNNFSKVKEWVIDTINYNPHLKVQYFEIVDPVSLVALADDERFKECRACIAVLTSGPRLIDNTAYLADDGLH